MKQAPLMAQPKVTKKQKSPNNKDSKSLSIKKHNNNQKQNHNNKFKQNHRNVSPTHSIKIKSVNDIVHQQLTTNSKSQIKKQLLPIPQFNQQKHSPLITISNNSNSKTHLLQQPYERRTQQKPNHKKSFQQGERSPSFQRSSVKLSEKMYNVSLASAKSINSKAIDHHTRSESTNAKQRRHANNVNNNKSSQVIILNGDKKNNDSKFPFSQFQNKQQAQHWLQQSIKKVKNESIKRINEEFMEVIERPLKMQSEIAKSTSQAQRCLHHNTPYSLYCSIDRQLLCVACIYSQKAHKSHRLIPLNKSQRQMKQDIDSFKNRIDQTIAQSQHLIRQASLNLIKIQKSYPIIQREIQQYFSSIHQAIDQKKNQQLSYIQSIRQQYKTELKIIGQLLNKVNNMFLEKLKLIAIENKFVENDLKKMRITQQQHHYSITHSNDKQQSPENTTTASMNEIVLDLTVKTRCNYETLSKYHKILQKHSDHLFDQKNKFDVKIQNFQQVLELIKYKLAVVVPMLAKDAHQKSFGDFLSGDNNLLQGKRKNQKEQDNQKQKVKLSPNKGNQDKSVQHRKEFSTSPQVPKGLSRRFL